MSKKILVVTPKFPYPAYGACEADRAAGLELLKKMGYEVMVISKVYGENYKAGALAVGERLGIAVVPVTYKYLHGLSLAQKLWHGLLRCLQPWYLDGAAYEYSEPEIQRVVAEALGTFKPDLVWFDYTYLWPLYHLVKQRGLPIVTRSINFEPEHFLDEDGRTPLNYLKFLPKLLSEYLTAKKSDVLFAITPHDAERYKKMGFPQSSVLPLRSLTPFTKHAAAVHDQKPLHVFFAGSTYNVHHNRAALKFLLTEVIPAANQKFPGAFTFHVLGGKTPVEFEKYFTDTIIKHDYLEPAEFKTTMEKMDIALIPSLYGGGMQQKIFEPITRGVPTITSARGLAGYPFTDQEAVVTATTPADFVQALGKLMDKTWREKIGQQAHVAASKLFSETVMSETISLSLASLLVH